MTPKEKDYMDRYIYQVIRRLPKRQRDEVRMELEELISDMYADKGSMEKVLSELGDPAEFAKQYQNEQKYLIGPQYFETYLWFVKIVLICTAVPILFISLINGIGKMPPFTSQNDVLVIIRTAVGILTAGIADALFSCVSAFGAVTLIFAVMERKKIQLEVKKISDARWMPKFLEPVPDKKAILSRGDSIAGIVFTIIFTVLLIFAPHFFAAVFTGDGTVKMIPVFNLDQWEIILPVFVLILLIGLADEILRLVTGVYCRAVMISNILCGVIQIILSTVALKILPIWNPDFASELQLELALSGREDSVIKILTYWNADMVSNVLLACIAVITFLEAGTTVYRTLRYGVSIRKD